MAGERRYIPASEFCASVRDGTHDSPKPVQNGRKLVTSRHLTTGRLDITDAYLISEEDFEAINKRSKVDRWDVLISMIGTVGEPCLIKEEPDFAIKNIGLFKTKSEADGKWLYYFLRSKDAQQSIREQSRGTTQQYIPLGALRDFPILVADNPEEQKAIAAVLGALDDKIELNRRMNATLEAMARALFQSWFIDFDPVRQNLDRNQNQPSPPAPLPVGEGLGVREPQVYSTAAPPAALDPAPAALFPDSFQDSPLGLIPKGWEVRPLAEAFDIKDGATFRKEDRVETGSIIAFGANGPVGFSTRANVSEPCIALGKIGSCGSLHRSWNPCWVTNNAFIVKPHRGGSLEFVWRTLSAIDFSQFIGGSANPYMPLKNFGHTPVVMPPALLLHAYQERAGSLAAKIVANDEESRTLATLRDTLLPKLLSGELSVAGGNLPEFPDSSNRTKTKP